MTAPSHDTQGRAAAITERLYYTDSYLRAFDAHIVDRDREGTRVYLDRTAFYPTSGGQPHDLGMLGGTAIVDVVDEGDRIAHVLQSPIASDVELVSGEIDWERRLDHMQQHTGQHLLSAVLADLFGYETVSVHFGRDVSTLDVDVETVSAAQLAEAESRANGVVFENRPVSVSFEDAASATGLRKPSQRAGVLRIVDIQGLDRSACGGTHVRSTGEIGAILLRGSERVRKSTRVEFLCGARAVRRARADFDALSAIAASMSAAVSDAPALVAARLEQIRESEGARRRLERELAGFRARTLYEAASPDAQGLRRIVVRDAASAEELRVLAQAVISLPRAVFVGTLSAPPSLLLATSEDSGVDAGKSLRTALASVGGRGGGSPRLAQGNVPDAAALPSVLASLC